MAATGGIYFYIDVHQCISASESLWKHKTLASEQLISVRDQVRDGFISIAFFSGFNNIILLMTILVTIDK